MDSLILVVDDAKFARMTLKRMLGNAGYTNIIEVTTAADAIAEFERETPALTLLDITLSDNTDLTLLKTLLEMKPEAKIVMNSAIGQNLIIADALDAGAVNFITKPTDESLLLEIVKDVLGGE